MQVRYLLLLAPLLLAPLARAEQWFALGGPGSERADTAVEVNLQSVLVRDGAGEAVIRVTHDVLQAHRAGFGYRSYVATVQFDCQRRTISLASAAYYPLPSGQGQRLGADSSGRQAGMPHELLDRVPMSARQALLRASCAGVPSS